MDKRVFTEKVRLIPAYNVDEAQMFAFNTGSEEFDWARYYEDSNRAFDDPNARNFNFVMRSDNTDDVLFGAGVMISAKVYKRDSAGNEIPGNTGLPPVGSAVDTLPKLEIPSDKINVAIQSDSLINNATMKINGFHLNRTNKNDIHRWTHLAKLCTYSKNYAELMSDFEYFYPDDETSAKADISPLSLKAKIANFRAPGQDFGANYTDAQGNRIENLTYNSFYLGRAELPANANPPASIEITADGLRAQGRLKALPQGAPANNEITTYNQYDLTNHPDAVGTFELDLNDSYNSGQKQRVKKCVNGQVVKMWVPLRYLFQSLSTFRDAIRSYTLELNLQINDPRAILFGMPLGLDTSVIRTTGRYDNRFDNFAVQITDMNLYIPAYKPNNEVRLMLKERDLAGFDYIRRYTDIEIVSSPYFDTSSASTSFEITGLTRKPVAIIAGFQHIRDELSARGNIHRYFNPGVERSFIDIRGVQRFPQNGIERISSDNYGMFYQAFLKSFDIEHKMINNDNLMTFKRFMNNKFLLCFDMRNSKIPRYDNLENNEVQFYASHSQMNAIAETVPGYKNYRLTPGQQTNDAGANVSEGTDATDAYADKKYRVWFFCFVEKNIRITKGKDELLQVFDDYNID